MTEAYTRISYERLRAFIAAAFERLGLPDADALAVASLMAEADLQGSDGHGVIRLPQYAKRIRAGGVNPRPDIRVVEERAGMALIHGDNGMGHLVMRRAAQMAIEKTRIDTLVCDLRSSSRMPGVERSCRASKARRNASPMRARASRSRPS